MNKKILLSLSVIGFVAAIAISGTVAYFGDTETAAGNTFTAGAIDLKIDNTCHFDGMICQKNDAGAYVWIEEIPGQSSTYPEVIGQPCTCSWEAKDMNGQAIFSLNDVKPGDIGEDTISLHVDSNPAWICAEFSNVAQYENGCNTPEAKLDTTCDNPGLNQGELFDNIRFSFWMDNGAGGGIACNNKKDGDETYVQQNVPATNLKYAIADSQTGGQPITDTCLGVEWSIPVELGNIAQTDSVTGDIVFKAYQARHNDNFVCYETAPVCGNSKLEAGEECDNGTGNTTTCVAPYNGSCSYCSLECKNITLHDGTCGDGTVDQGNEECDDGLLNGTPNHCNATCNGQTTSICGNSTIENGETCDDGNIVPGDGCNETCQLEVCGNGIVDSGEQCDDANHVNTDACLDSCKLPTCGDGYIYNGFEECDDGNNVSFDSCNANCVLEPSVEVQKVVNNYDVCSGQASDFQMLLNSNEIDQNKEYWVTPGTYSVSEESNPGYNAVFSGGCDESGVVTLSGHEHKICTVTNDCAYGKIVVTKSVTNDNGGTKVVANFNLLVNGTSVTSGVAKNFAPGTYNVSESGSSGYQGYFSGDCDPSTHKITVAAGETKNCYILNDDIAPVVTLIKNVVGGTAQPQQFLMRVDGIPVPHDSSITVMANTNHNITEDAFTGYHFTSISGAGCPTDQITPFQLTPGQSITCTVTNTINP